MYPVDGFTDDEILCGRLTRCNQWSGSVHFL